jgi:hypothetical protein
MIAASAASAVPTLVAVAFAFIGAANALVRLLLCALAAYTARQVLRASCTDEFPECARAHQLAVLSIVMTPLSPYGYPTWREATEPGLLATPADTACERHA